GEIRKRIAQYYHEAGHEDELRIDLPSGSYVPEFHLSLQTAITRVERPAHRAANRWILVTALAILAVSSAVAFSLQPWKHASAVDVFWQPITSAETPVLVCVGPPDRRSVGAAPMEESDPARPEKAPSVLDLLRSDSIPLADSVTLARVSRLLGAHGRPVRVQSMSATTRADLQSTPAVLIGAFNNDWTMRVTRQLRFGFEADWKNNRFQIVDRRHPGDTEWRTDMSQPYPKLTEDYAIVARFNNPIGERMVVVAAGLGQFGTLAAGEFLTDSRYMDKFVSSLPAGWQQKNVEALIAVRVIDGNCGPPRVINFYTW